MNYNIVIKDKLELFLHLLYDLKVNKEPGDSKKINLPFPLKSVLNEFYSSMKLKQFIIEKVGIYKENYLDKIIQKIKEENIIPSKKSNNIYYFNQNNIFNPNSFFSTKNEISLLNDVICLKMFSIIKVILTEIPLTKKKKIKTKKNFVFTSEMVKTVLKKKKQINKNSSCDSIFTKQRNYQIIDKTSPSTDKMCIEIFMKPKKEKIKLPYINNINVFNNMGRNKIKKKKKFNSLSNIFYNDSFKSKDELYEKKINEEKNNFDYKGLFKLYNFLNKQKLI